MSLTASEMTPADIAACTGGGNGGGDGFGMGNNGWWIILLFILLGGWGGNYGGGGGNNGGAGGLYPWMNQSNQINDGFRDQMLNTTINGIQNGVVSGFGDVQNSLCAGFAGVNAAITNAQMNALERSFASQVANTQAITGLQSQLAQCCCDNRSATEGLRYTIATENCADRYEAAQNTRDIIDSQTRSTQAILDKLCQLELDGKQDRINDLERQLTAANLAASQTAQTARLERNQLDTMNNLVTELRSCPIPCQPVYGSQPIFTCSNNNNGCGCGGNF